MDSDLPIPSFEFATATRIIFGSGTLKQIGSVISSVAQSNIKVLVITGKNKSRAQPLFDHLEKAKLQFVSYGVGEEPTIDMANEGLELGRQHNCTVVISFGGGSVIDTGKAIGALLTNGGDFMDYMEVIGRGKVITKPSAPFIAIPTTSGTGAEVTRNAVLCSNEHKQKASIRSQYMIPSVALIDPELTLSVPPDVTASTGLDAFTQLVEPFVSNKANPLTDAICREGLKRAARSLRKVFDDGKNKEGREDMSIASLFGGIALANAKLGSVHGFAGVIGGMYKSAPHGAVCASLLPQCIDINVKALRSRDPNSIYLKRYEELARIITSNPSATSEEGVEWIKSLCQHLKISKLSSYGVKKEDVNIIVEKSASSSSMQGNCIKLTKEELLSIMEDSL